MARVLALGFTVTALALSSLPVASPALAQGVAPVGPAKGKAGRPAAAAKDTSKTDPAAAEKALEAGIKHYQSGKYDAAIGSLNTALQGGGLASARMARGLYYRGLSYKAGGKPAQSISDLTSALWLKGGLDDKERADAQAQRAAAYREAGLGEPPAVNSPTRTASAAEPAKSTASTSAPAAAPAKSADSGGVTGAVTGFFGNLFGDGAKPAPEAVGATTATGSVAPPKASEVSSWNSETKTTPSSARPSEAAAVKVAAAETGAKQSDVPSRPAAPVTQAAPEARSAAAPALASGKYRLQVAAVRTRAEADAIAARLKRELGKKLASRETVVDEAAVGNMGTFYRVRVGPYADANEPRRLCVTLRASNGFDCLVVTQ